MTTAIGTVIAKNYLSYARVLARSLKHHHPELELWCLLTDRVDDSFDPEAEPFRMIELQELKIRDLASLCFRYSRKQLAAATKGHLLSHLICTGADQALFIDPDMLVLARLDDLLSQVKISSVTLTPHLLAPPDHQDVVTKILLSGNINAGVVGVSRSDPAASFLEWWIARCEMNCLLETDKGMHYDQRWLDLVPAMFDGVTLVRDQGVNVGYWNLPQRDIEVIDDRVMAGDSSCKLLHFSGFRPDRPGELTAYSPEMTFERSPDAREIFARYASLLIDAGWMETKDLPYAYGSASDGRAISQRTRELYWELGADADRFGDPFEAGPGSFLDWASERNLPHVS